MEMTTIPMFPLILLGAVVLLLAIFFYYVPFLLWISAKVSGVNISLLQLFLMRIRKVPPYVIAQAMIEAHKAGLKTLTRDELDKGEHRPFLPDGYGYRLGGARRLRGCADVRKPEGHQHAAGYRRG